MLSIYTRPKRGNTLAVCSKCCCSCGTYSRYPTKSKPRKHEGIHQDTHQSLHTLHLIHAVWTSTGQSSIRPSHRATAGSPQPILVFQQRFLPKQPYLRHEGMRCYGLYTMHCWFSLCASASCVLCVGFVTKPSLAHPGLHLGCRPCEADGTRGQFVIV